MSRRIEARLAALERLLAPDTGASDYDRRERESRSQYQRAILGLFFLVPEPLQHPELVRRVCEDLEPEHAAFTAGLRLALAEGTTLRATCEPSPELVAPYERVVARAREIPEGLAGLFDRLGRSARAEGKHWRPEGKSLAELFAVALGHGTQPEGTE